MIYTQAFESSHPALFRPPSFQLHLAPRTVTALPLLRDPPPTQQASALHRRPLRGVIRLVLDVRAHRRPLSRVSPRRPRRHLSSRALDPPPSTAYSFLTCLYRCRLRSTTTLRRVVSFNATFVVYLAPTTARHFHTSHETHTPHRRYSCCAYPISLSPFVTEDLIWYSNKRAHQSSHFTSLTTPEDLQQLQTIPPATLRARRNSRRSDIIKKGSGYNCIQYSHLGQCQILAEFQSTAPVQRYKRPSIRA